MGNKGMKEKSNKTILIIIALLAAIVYTFALIAAFRNKSTEVYSQTGVWDLRSLLAENNICWLNGPVEYIPDALLTPKEFAAKEEEAVIGHPENVSQFATSRLRLLMPDDGYYAFYGRSIDYACRLYANGILVLEMGSPGESKETNIPDTGNVSFTVKADGGVIEIIQQVSNFVHRSGGIHTRWNLSRRNIRTLLWNDFSESIKLGTYLGLFFVHVIFFLFLRRNKANLYFALFCLTWLIRTGITGTKVFTDIFPALPWELKFRAEYLSLPVTAILLVSLLDVLFPLVLQKRFRYALYGVSAFFAAIFLFADTVFASYALLFCYALYIPAIIYIIIRFVIRFAARPTDKKRRLEAGQSIFLAGAVIFFLAAIHDMFFYNDYFGMRLSIYLRDLSSFSMLLFVFCEAAAVFIVTAQEMKAAAAENAALKEKTRMIEQQLISRREHYAEIIRLLVELKAGLPAPHPNERKLCENHAVNAVAVYYLGLAESQGAAFRAQLDISEDSGSVPAMDLCVISGDLLGNALDNCRNMERENKYISIKSQIKGNFLGIEVISGFSGQEYEGVGLSTVKALCEKHRGNLEQEISGNERKVTALVQMKKAKETVRPDTPDNMEAFFLEHGLSRREIEVANLMILEGLLAKDIGERLFISTYTVNEHITNIYRKLEEKRRPEFMALFVNAAKN